MISVIVLNYNGRGHLGPCLESLRRQTFQDFETILVDNGSSDGSVDFVRRLFPEVRCVANPSNLGFSAGNNVGIRLACGELIALLNNDTVAADTWLEHLRLAARKYPHAGVFASKLLLFHQKGHLDAAGDDFHAAGFAAKRGWLQPDGPPFDSGTDVFGACAAAAMYRLAVLRDAGMFDEDFFANGEDVDLSFRARLAGSSCRYVPEAVVYHKGGATIGQSDHWFYLMRRNQIWIMVKNMPAALLLKYTPQIAFYHLSSLCYHTLKGRGAITLRAYADAFKKIHLMLAKRRRIQTRRNTGTKAIESMLTTGKLLQRARRPITTQLTNTGYSIERHH